MSDTPSTRNRNILLLSGGAKVAIARIVKQSASKRGANLVISDRSENLPTRFVADEFLAFPDSEGPEWRTDLVRIANEQKIGLVIPSRETDLAPLARASSELKSIGCVAAVSSLDTIELCGDKWRAYEHMRDLGVPTPHSCLTPDFEAFNQENPGPFIAKPRFGSGGTVLRFDKDSPLSQSIPSDWIIQQIANGQEYTVNVYLDKTGACRCVIPHRRLMIDGGESVQARTENHPLIEKAIRELAESLPGATGPVNIQLFLDEAESSFQVIEINPRLGGGFPLAHEAKGTYIEWLARERLDGNPIEDFDQWTRNLTMYRFRDAIFEIS